MKHQVLNKDNTLTPVNVSYQTKTIGYGRYEILCYVRGISTPMSTVTNNSSLMDRYQDLLAEDMYQDAEELLDKHFFKSDFEERITEYFGTLIQRVN